MGPRGFAGALRDMDEATVKAMLEQHFTSGDPVRSHEMYHDDAVLEFPQSGERFVGVENLRAWRSNYPASTTVEFREIRGRDDLWVVELSIRYEEGPWNLGVSILEFRGDRIARESIYVTEGWDPPEWRAEWRSAP
jgi:SnoaL-like domain